MRNQTTSHQFESGALGGTQSAVGAEHLHLRNHDHQWGYDLSLEVIDEDGVTVFEDRYYLHPGRTESELDAVSAGEYEVRATLDNLQEETIQCRIDGDPKNTVVVETGNGVLSLTQGLSA